MIEDIVQLNNSGVYFLASGDSLNALKAFKTAIGAMAQEIEVSDFMHNDTLNFCPAVKIGGLEDPYFFAYDHALVLDSSADLTWANSCLLFNLALTFHQKGLMCCNDAAKLMKAVRLYELAAQLIVNSIPSANTLAMAAWNNQAFIYYTLGDHAKARELLERVREGAEVLPEVAGSRLGPLETRFLDEIYLNVVIVEPPSIAPSA